MAEQDVSTSPQNPSVESLEQAFGKQKLTIVEINRKEPRKNSVSDRLVAYNVGLTGFVRNKSLVFDKFVRSRVAATMTRSRLATTAIQNVLNGKTKFITLAFARNFETIREGTECAMGPARSTILSFE